MFPFNSLILFAMFCLTCQSLAQAPNTQGMSAGQLLWEQGQTAMLEGKPEVAVGFYEKSLARDPSLVRNYLSLAAAFLEQGEQAKAYPHLEKYVEVRPEHLTVRAYLAELLLRMDKISEARDQYDRFEAEAQTNSAVNALERIHCHARLVAIADMLGDEYAAHLHRGLGLMLLADQSRPLKSGLGEAAEGFLCRAATELSMARNCRPEEARPSWYLYQIWARLGQRHNALVRLNEARDAAPFAFLTSAEQQALHHACRELASEAR